MRNNDGYLSKELKIAAIALIFLVISSLVFMVYKDDKLRLNSEFEAADGYEYLVHEQSHYSWTLSEKEAEGDFVLSAPLYSYKPGDYSISFICDVSAEGSGISIETDGYVTEDNELKTTVLEFVPLEVGNSNYSFDYSIPSFVRNVRVVVHYSGEGTLTINKVYQQSKGLYYHDALYLILCMIAGCLFVLWLKKKGKLNYRFYVIVGIGLIAAIPALGKEIYYGSDIQFHLMRIQGLAEGFKSGQFPVRFQSVWHSNTGYPVSIFYPDLILYPAGALVALGVSEYFVLRSIFIASSILTAFLSFKSYALITKSEDKGLVAAVFYTLSGFRFLIMFHSVGIGNLLALTFIPVVLCGIYEIIWGDSKKWPVLALGMTGVISSHLLSSVFAAMLCAICCVIGIVRLFKDKRIIPLMKAVALAVALNLWFIVPFLAMYGYDINIVHQGSRINETTVFLTQMFQLFNYGGKSNINGAGTVGEMPISVGFIFAVVILVYMVERIGYKKKANFETDLCFFIGILALWISSEFFPWDYIYRVPLLGRFLYHAEFCWRYYTIATVALSLVAAYCITEQTWIDRKKAIVIGMAACVLCYIPNVDAFVQSQDAYFLDKYQYVYDFSEENENREFLYDSLTDDQVNSLNQQVDAENASISNLKRNGINISCDYEKLDQSANSKFTIPIIGFPYYDVEINGQKVALDTGKSRQIVVNASDNMESKGTITVHFKEPFLWRIAEIVSLLACMAMAVFAWHRIRFQKQ